jgi:hypothetical protein
MSFSEMMESGRGPGVIGMLLALFVLLGFGVLFMFAFDEGLQGEEQSIESFVSRQAKEIEDIKGSILHGEKQLAQAPAMLALGKELKEMMRGNQFRSARLDSLRTGISSSNEAVTSKMMAFETYKDDYRTVVRRKAKGEKMERLETRKGDVYENITIRDVTPIGIQIMHNGGHKRIAFEELTAALQARFQFDPKQKAEAIAREDAQRREHETAVSVATAAEGQQLAERKEKEAEARRDAMTRNISIKESRMRSLQDEIDALEDALPKEGMKGISRAPQMRMQISNKRGQLRELQAEVSRMHSQLSQ